MTTAELMVNFLSKNNKTEMMILKQIKVGRLSSNADRRNLSKIGIPSTTPQLPLRTLSRTAEPLLTASCGKTMTG
jgi:hypothetical protein